MNYIKHLNNFFDKVQSDREIASCQIAMYMALFQCWNRQRFNNPMSINRDELMRLSRISSKSTYHRSINILHQNGYIDYLPSYNPFIGSQIIMNNLSIKLEKKTSTKVNQSVEGTSSKNSTAIGQTSSKKNIVMSTAKNTPIGTAIEPSYKHINNKHKNTKLSLSEDRENFEQNQEIKFSNDQENNTNLIENDLIKKEKSCAKKEMINIPTLDEVKAFFQEKQAPAIEAEKFFNYFESNGWLVGGKTKMKKWKASASNWIINANLSKLNVFGIQKPLDTSTNKRYDEPL